MPHVVSSISQIISLFDPLPSFQSSQNADFSYSPSLPQNLVRNFGVASAGFPHSFDFAFQSRPVPNISANNIPLPANAYTINFPSLVYGYGILNDASFSVLQINTGLARIEPGFSRIRVDYVWNDSFGNSINDTYYFDCPFYEGFDITAQELNNIVNYVEESTAFLQTEINLINTEVDYALSHELWRGTSVSGRLTTNAITTGLEQGALTSSLFSHSLPPNIDEEFEKVYQSGPYPVMAPSEIWNTAGTGMIQRYNYSGKTVQNNYSFFYTNNASHPKSCGILAENTDGTLTFWFFDTNVNNQDISYPTTSLTQAISYIGPISPEYISSGNGAGGGTFVFYVRCSGDGGSVSQPITSASNLVPTDVAGSQYWWNAADEFGNCTSSTSFCFLNTDYPKTFNVQSNSAGGSQYAGPVNVYYPPIKGVTYDSPAISTSAGTNVWFRCLVKPAGGKGSVIHWSNSNGNIDVGHNASSQSYNDSIYTNTSSMIYTGHASTTGPIAGLPDITLLGPVILKPTITGAGASVYCVGQKLTLTGSNLTSSFKVYINSLSYPCTNITYSSGTVLTATIPDNCPTGPATVILYDGTSSDTVSKSGLFTVQGAPANASVTPSSASAGSTVTINGTGFGSYVTNVGFPGNSSVGIASLGTYPENLAIISSWSDTQIICTIPTNTPVGATTVFIYTSCSEITNCQLTVTPEYSLSVTPSSPTVNTAATQQFNAILTNVVTGATTNVNPYCTWLIGEGVNETFTTGDSTYGTINGAGLYTAPNVTPPGQTNSIPVVHVQATYQNFTANQPIQINPTATMTLSPTTVDLVIPATQQFIVTLYEGNAPINITNNATYSVGASTNGTISNTGLYTPPTSLPSSQPVVLTVSYSYAETNYTQTANITLNSGSMAISPKSQTLVVGQSCQFSAVLTENNNPVNVTAYATWSVNGVIGGNSSLGIIAAGYYTAPSTVPSSEPVIITVSYGFDYVVFSANAFVSVNTATMVLNPTSANLTLPTPQQFQAILLENNIPLDVTQAATWSVNGIQNGNNEYGIIYQGYYTPPVFLPPTEPLTITVSYVFANSTYTQSASITLSAAPVNQMTIQVESQINIYLGDGRFGYIPTGTQTIGYLNQYCFVQFEERLLSGTRTPDPSYLPIQQLGFIMKNALDSDIAMAIYNTGSAIPQADGSILKTRTVVLGIIDPSDGLFHSMWDIANPLPTSGGIQSHTLPSDMSFYADKLKAFSAPHNFDGTLMQYIDDLSGGAQSQLNQLISRSNIMVVGQISYDSNTHLLAINEPLRILGISDEKSYGVLGIIPEQNIKVLPEEYVYFNRDFNLKIGKFTDVFQDAYDSSSIILGAVLDSFYTAWPLLNNLDSDTSGIKAIGKPSWMRVGPMLVQWGTTEEFTINKKEAFTSNKITFEMPFKESCHVLAQSFESNGSFPTVSAQNFGLNDFEIRAVNVQNVMIKTKFSWLAIGC
jgi:hypothetical protein